MSTHGPGVSLAIVLLLGSLAAACEGQSEADSETKSGDDAASTSTADDAASQEASTADGSEESTSDSDEVTGEATDDTGDDDDGGSETGDDDGEFDVDEWNCASGREYESCSRHNDDCPPGYKCNPYNCNGGIVIEGAMGCVPILDEAKGLNDPCSTLGDYQDPIDDCGENLRCATIDEDGFGYCRGFCNWHDQRQPCEDPTAFCNDPTNQPSVVIMCDPTCDPRDAEDCPEDYICVLEEDMQGFFCIHDRRDDWGVDFKQLGETCEWSWECDLGLVCDGYIYGQNASGLYLGECAALCDLDGEDSCPREDAVCEQSWWSEAAAMPEAPLFTEIYKDLGICRVPERG